MKIIIIGTAYPYRGGLTAFNERLAKEYITHHHMNPFKIIIIGTAYPYRGGLSAFNERLAKEYVLQGHDVEIYTFTLQYPSFLFPGKTQYSNEPAPDRLKIFRKI